ncbi:MAG: hypothetical protein VX640_07775 [Pseudomonadota bacterium]|nr:hypothetical protein [Pseudomonadota bacterium]
MPYGQSVNRRLLAGALALSAVFSAGCAKRQDVYRVQFENSCSADVQATFAQALTLLHSFEYPEASKLFGKAVARDPSCAIARWGAAMTLWHPLWAPPSPAELEEGARLLAETRGLKMTPREAAYIDALGVFFASADPATHGARARAYEDKMNRVYRAYLDDPEATLFYALSLLATADPRDKTYAQQFKAAALINWVGDAHPAHPGVLHYTIHAFDYPGLAHLALPAALAYAKAAPDSAHAQHMPSHIFTRLGMCEQTIASSRDSIRSAAEYTERAGLAGQYDEGLHSMDYLMYALLQTARDDEAAQLLDALGDIEKTNVDNFKVAFTYASSPARYALERRQWKEAKELPLAPATFPWNDFPWAQSINNFARGIGAARSGDLDAARRELATLQDLKGKLSDATPPYWREEVQVQIDEVRSWILLGEGKTGEALEAALAAAEREDAVDKHPVTPGEVLPARELYADMLREEGLNAEALQQYELVMQGSPNRLNALLGAAYAAKGAGEAAVADDYFERARIQAKDGDRNRAGLY